MYFCIKLSFCQLLKDFKRVWFICYFINPLRINVNQLILILETWDKIQISWCLKHKTIECSDVTILRPIKKNKNWHFICGTTKT